MDNKLNKLSIEIIFNFEQVFMNYDEEQSLPERRGRRKTETH